MRPRESVDPMYMPGRLRTASRPSSTDRCRAVYAFGSDFAGGADRVPAPVLAATPRD